MHIKQEIAPLNAQLQQEELSLQAELGSWLANEENQWQQKSRASWLQLDDKNTKFFYSAVKAKQARNQITHLINEEGETISNLSTIKELAPAFYEKLFNQDSYWTVFPEVIIKRKLTIEATSWISRRCY